MRRGVFMWLMERFAGRRLDDHKERIEQDAKKGGKDYGGNSTGEEIGNGEGVESILEGEVTADTGNQDDRANG